MTVEVENQETEEVVKTEEQLAKAMYPDPAEEEKGQEAEVDEETKTEKETPKEEAKEEAGEQEETKDGEDQEIKLTLSKDSPLDDSALDAVKEFAKANDIPEKAAQAMLERDEAAATSRVEQQQADLDASVADWTKKIEGHPEYGGDKLEAATLIAIRPLKKFGGEEIDAFLEKTGFSNHPAVFDYHYKIGQAMGDDNFVKGGQPPAGPKTPTAHRMYPNDVKKE